MSNSVPVWTVVTGLVALYGAVLSTLNFLRAGPKLRFAVRHGVIVVGSPDKRTFVQTTVTNHGDRPTTLTNIVIYYFERPWSWAWLRNHPTRMGVLNNPNPTRPFPLELAPGNVWQGLSEQTPELVAWGTKGAVYFGLHHSHRTKPKWKRVRFLPVRAKAPPTPAG